MVVYLPILALTGVEGKMFQPDGVHRRASRWSARMVLSLTFVPAAVAMFLNGSVASTRTALMRGCRRGLRAALERSLALRAP